MSRRKWTVAITSIIMIVISMLAYDARIKRKECKETRQCVQYLRAKEYLRNYKYVLNKPHASGIPNTAYPDKIWIYWAEDSFEARHKLVRICIDSIRKHCGGREIIFVTEKNYRQYVTLPPHIVEKYLNKKMKLQHFVDVIRVHLLRDHGGTWFDAATYITADIPKQIWDAEFVVGPSDKQSSISVVFPTLQCKYATKQFNNGYMHASKPNNYFFNVLCDFYDEYWKNEDTAAHYFFVQIFAIIACEEDEKCRQIYEQSVALCKKPFYTEALNYVIKKRYDQELWEQMKAGGMINKLSLHLMGKCEFSSNTFGAMLVSGRLK
ncbi:MAG: capsular polysaccharide synthesis protein [Holosporales bacterium]|jgi:hypothetical protein|nr:capsular polysaccharide synthesis protein [Holosporales bacterium]